MGIGMAGQSHPTPRFAGQWEGNSSNRNRIDIEGEGGEQTGMCGGKWQKCTSNKGQG